MWITRDGILKHPGFLVIALICAYVAFAVGNMLIRLVGIDNTIASLIAILFAILAFIFSPLIAEYIMRFQRFSKG
jgi:uncharacterized membrane protein